MVNMSLFVERLNELMIDNGLTSPQLAQAIGVRKSTIYRYLKAERLPGVDIIIKLADALDCSIDFLLGFAADDYKSKHYECPPFSERLPILLKEFNTTKYQLVKDTKLPESIVYSWQSGQSTPTIDSLITLSKYFNCSIDYLLGREK